MGFENLVKSAKTEAQWERVMWEWVVNTEFKDKFSPSKEEMINILKKYNRYDRFKEYQLNPL